MKVILATPPILTTTTGSAEPGGGGERGVIDRHQRRALAAGRHVVGAEIIDDIDAKALRQRCAIADLDGEAPLRPVQHGLAVKADDVDFFAASRPWRSIKGRTAAAWRAVTIVSAAASAPGRAARSERRAASAMACAQQRAVLVVIGKETRAAKSDGVFAVGLDQGHVDPVHRGAAHQADGYGVGHLDPGCVMVRGWHFLDYRAKRLQAEVASRSSHMSRDLIR